MLVEFQRIMMNTEVGCNVLGHSVQKAPFKVIQKKGYLMSGVTVIVKMNISEVILFNYVNLQMVRIIIMATHLRL